MNYTLICDESFDGIMSGIYEAWSIMKQGHGVHIHPGRTFERTLFSEYEFVDTDIDKAVKVADSIALKISPKAYSMIFKASLHTDESRADDIFKFMVLGFRHGKEITKMLQKPEVMRIRELGRKVGNEVHYFCEFLRFKELKGNVLYGKIAPKCDVIPLLYKHFEDRFPNEDFIIYDEKRYKSAVHTRGERTIIIDHKNMEEQVKELLVDDDYEDLWKIFFNTIGIEARKNPDCQRNNMPLWYRKNATEFME